MALAEAYSTLNLYVYVSDVHADLKGAIGVLLPRQKGWKHHHFVVDGSEVIMVNPEVDLRPLTSKDRVLG